MRIRKLEKTDLLIRVQWMNDERVYRSMHFSLPVTLRGTEDWFERNFENENRSDVVFLDDTEKVCAFGGLTSISGRPRRAELYIFVNPNSQHHGIGTKATLLLCEWGFSQLNLDKIYLYTNEDNHSAIKVYKKCGFSLEGVHRHEYMSNDGAIMNRLYFGLLKSEWTDGAFK